MNITGTATAPARRMLTASEAFLEMESRGISLVPICNGVLWAASVDVVGTGHNRKRALRSVSALGPDGLTAVNRLVWKLDGELEVAE